MPVSSLCWLCCALFLLCLTALPRPSSASYCGQSAIPFSFEVRADGQPVLGCARPACFGWTADGQRAADAAQFYRIWGRPDGFVRLADSQRQRPSPSSSVPDNGQPEISFCDRSFTRSRCPAGSWLGGIGPNADPKTMPLKLLCCSYVKLAASEPAGLVRIGPGQVLQGGESLDAQGRPAGFEYIANVQRLPTEEGEVPAYSVEVRKFAGCAASEIGQEMRNGGGERKHQAQGVEEEEQDEKAEVVHGEDDEKTVLADFSEYEQPKGEQQQSTANDVPSVQQKSAVNAAVDHVHLGKRLDDRLDSKKIQKGSSLDQQSQLMSQRKEDEANNASPVQQPPREFWPSPSPFGGYQMVQQQPQQWPVTSAPPPSLLFNNLLANPAEQSQQQQQERGQRRRPPLLQIPSPEEIEEAIPPHGRQLLSHLARTFLGLQRLF